MTDKFVDSPMTPIASPPSGYGPTGKGVLNGEDCAPFSEYKRTSSPNAAPEKTYDGSVPKIEVPIPSSKPEGLPSKG